MANTGTMTVRMDNLWNEEAFQMLFAETGWEKIKACLDHCGTQCETVEMDQFVKVLKKYIPEERLKTLYLPEFLEHPERFSPARCILYANEPDAITTLSVYTCDANIARLLTKIFRDRPVKCNWFIDGSGDYGSYTLRDNAYYDYVEGNLQEDLNKADGFYCVRRQRDPDRNPGNTPCPDTDKCHLCGAYASTEQAPSSSSEN